MNNSSGTNGHEFSQDGIRRINFGVTTETVDRKKSEWKNFIQTLDPYPEIYRGRGIVICAGGLTYLTCAYVNIKQLRKSGCPLPVELWHQDGELTDMTIVEFQKLGVTCRNFADYTIKKVSNGYQTKPLSILHSSFKEVLFLDADNNCLRDPAFLFEKNGYKSTGALFWPDYWRTERTNPIWQITDSDEFASFEQESGQLLINKEKCWRELNLCLFFNLDPFYYNILWGDKDTFRFSWMALKSPFHMIGKAVGALGFREEEQGFLSIAMVQHDDNGIPLFIHANLLKWNERSSKELYWREIRRLVQDRERRIDMNYHPHFDKYFLSIEGEVEEILPRNPIAQLEKESLWELEMFRNSEFYFELSETGR